MEGSRRNEVTWSIGGEAGYGIKVTGEMFGRLCSRSGLHVFDYTEYPSLIRGGYNHYRIEIAENEVRSVPHFLDILVALNADTVTRDGKTVEEGGVIVYDSSVFPLDEKEWTARKILLLPIPFKEIAVKAVGNELMKNTVALGASVGLLGLAFEDIEKVLTETFGSKGEDVVTKNVAAAKAGYEEATAFNTKMGERFVLQKIKEAPRRMLVTGSKAVGLGALASGLTFYAGYPMTPSTPLLEFLASKADEHGLVVHQAEDEITAINAAIGASFAGARAMTGSAGGGFSLMVESIGLAAMTETPLVIYVASRPGPATGLPTWTNQADLQFVLHAAQDEFPRIILAPGDVDECFYETVRAFNLAEKYQVPVFILSDKALAECAKTTEPPDMSRVAIDRGKLITDDRTEETDFFPRYGDAEDGVSPRTIPGVKNGIHVANSDEHDIYGLVDESSENRVAMMTRRFQKVSFIEEDMPTPKIYGDKNAELTVLCWGSVKGVALDALDIVSEEGMKVNVVHVVGIWPFPKKALTEILTHARNILLIENNATAQFGALLREQTGIQPHVGLLKNDGRPFFLEEVVEAIRKQRGVHAYTE